MDRNDGRWRSDWDDGASRRDVLSNNPVTGVGTWQHIVVSATPGGNMLMFVDGVQQSDTQGLGAVGIDPTNGWLIGSERATSRFFIGAIDDVMVYDAPLTAGDALAIFQAGPVPEPSRVILLSLGAVLGLLRRRRR